MLTAVLIGLYTLVLEPFLVIFHGIFHEPLAFSRCTQESSGDIECLYQENTSDKWDITWYNTRKRWITLRNSTNRSLLLLKIKQ